MCGCVCVWNEYHRDAFQNRSLLIPLKNEHSPAVHPSERERKYRRKKERKDNELWISFKRDIAPWPPHCFSFLSSSPPSPGLSLSLCVLCLLLNRYGLTVMGQWPVCIRQDCNRGALCLPGLSVEVITRSYLKPLFKAFNLTLISTSDWLGMTQRKGIYIWSSFLQEGSDNCLNTCSHIFA